MQMKKNWERLLKQIFLLLVFILQILFTGGFSIAKTPIESSAFKPRPFRCLDLDKDGHSEEEFAFDLRV